MSAMENPSEKPLNNNIEDMKSAFPRAREGTQTDDLERWEL